ncbi:MAG TPA: cupredoxin domain-containing protein [Candidatus Cybelea sp.]|nr:cupredoxin domain-containing protein [Candidatus Cybelea sp.]
MAAVFLAGARAGAVEESRALTIKDHRFDPAVLEVPAGVKVKLTVRNLDSTPEEFDSHALNREKVISGGGEAQIWIGPLDAGSYDFMGEYHADTALGKVIAK